MNLKTTIAATAALLAISAQASRPAIPADPRIEAEVEKTLARMSLDEKIGQMTELSIDVLGSRQGKEFFLDDAKVAEAIGKYKVGSVLNAPGPFALTPQKWEQIISKLQGGIDEGDRHTLHLWSRPAPFLVNCNKSWRMVLNTIMLYINAIKLN